MISRESRWPLVSCSATGAAERSSLASPVAGAVEPPDSPGSTLGCASRTAICGDLIWRDDRPLCDGRAKRRALPLLLRDGGSVALARPAEQTAHQQHEVVRNLLGLAGSFG